MPLSETIVMQIDADLTEVRRFLDEPRNYAKWAAVDPDSYRQLPDGDWSAQVRFGGLRHIRFLKEAPEAGMHDHAVFAPGEEPLWMPMRSLAKGEGTELRFTFTQRPGMSEESFRSTIEWITIDLLTLKTLLEARSRRA
ncbi:MAG: hypothetical protein KIT02_09775 [Devosia sp.]|uniref:hypothetical protein n=1 Tax=Devosia sp. TaxID=1871048 RepID=UPI0024CCA9F8|nr:hypothetical protein [Devosia sp.]UYN98262.1 MAG: hypothetical protein KIT02_09775 [Devosia sp.]